MYFYLEIQNHGLDDEMIVAKEIEKMSLRLDIPLVATNDVHYIEKEDSFMHKVLICVQTGNKIGDKTNLEFQTDEFYLKSPEEMLALFPEVPEALENTHKISHRCNVEFDFKNKHLPEFHLPDGWTDAYDYLEYRCYEGAKKRYGETLSPEIKERLDYMDKYSQSESNAASSSETDANANVTQKNVTKRFACYICNEELY